MSTTHATVESYYAALRAGDVESWLALFAPGAVVHNPADAAPLSGLAALRDLWEELTCPFRRLGVTEDLVVVTGGRAAVKWSVSGEGWTGQHADAEGIDIIDTDGAALITELRSYWQPERVRSQLCGA